MEETINTALGDSAGTDVGQGYLNTFIGQASGAANEYADFNTFVGARAGWDNNRTNSTTNANRNTYLGYRTGYTNREGEDNVGIGAYADYDNNNRSRTTFIGADIDVRENDVIAVGYSADNNVQYSIAIGWNIDVDAASNAIMLGYNTKATLDADYSVGIGSRGYFAGSRSVGIGELDTITANDAIAVGYDAKVAGDNSIAIGSNTKVTADNEVYVGNASTASIGGVVNWTAASDGRFKTGVVENIPGLDFIDLLRPVSYNFDTEKLHQFNGTGALASFAKSVNEKNAIVYSGFVAQIVNEAAK